ncbi:hypothetical protein, partial [Micromonospora sp. WMMD736]|uniref:hypothetical protein n=1 Tax=Micromonospora sp. WMMD736 TaxID=3404112 RepID=UPI003B95985A
ALISALLLATRGVALTLGQIHRTVDGGLQYLEFKQIPMTESARHLATLDGVRAALDALSDGHPVTRVDDGWEPVWRIAPEHEHAAAFYRNSAIHAFLETSIVELALAHASHADGDRLDAFWTQTFRLRDLLKFDFYFAASAEFRCNIAEELRWYDGWERAVRGSADLDSALFDGIESILLSKRPLMSWTMLRPFFEAYEIVAHVLCKAPASLSEEDLVRRALGVGQQYVAQGRIRSREPVSTLVFATARQVADDQGLFQQDPSLTDRRNAFRKELRDILSDIDHVEHLARRQFTAREVAARRGEEP